MTKRSQLTTLSKGFRKEIQRRIQSYFLKQKVVDHLPRIIYVCTADISSVHSFIMYLGLKTRELTI